ncbi:hypothetical protein MKZ38_004850 [Zalerion maritima]|uniref:Uncharacterized protein n=1 Tax=Zalerion maritima TaxID=339359 RepID=A0AAD5RL28_9PEZI|nr:hypothetical protein MKZ38_004850 [Zalerion maritima]
MMPSQHWPEPLIGNNWNSDWIQMWEQQIPNDEYGMSAETTNPNLAALLEEEDFTDDQPRPSTHKIHAPSPRRHRVPAELAIGHRPMAFPLPCYSTLPYSPLPPTAAASRFPQPLLPPFEIPDPYNGNSIQESHHPDACFLDPAFPDSGFNNKAKLLPPIHHHHIIAKHGSLISMSNMKKI